MDDVYTNYMDDGYPNYKECYSITYCSYGDCDNSCLVERSNHKYLREEYEDFVIPHYGMFKSAWIAIYPAEWVSITDPDDIETLECLMEEIDSLINYPCLDESLLSEMEISVFDQAWDDWIKDDFERAIENKFGEIIVNHINLRELYNELKDVTGTYEEIEAGGSVYIDIDRLTEALTRR
jgi:hypothetical protein